MQAYYFQILENVAIDFWSGLINGEKQNRIHNRNIDNFYARGAYHFQKGISYSATLHHSSFSYKLGKLR